MGQESKQRTESAPLGERIAKARREGRTQQALELARQNYKHDPTAENLELLRQTTLERGKGLQALGYTKDAATVFTNAADMGGSPEFLAQLAQLLSQCGAASQVAALQTRLPEGADRSRLAAFAIDAALQQGAAGRSQVPSEHQAAFDSILQAFAHAEKGEDDAARALLQNIGLQSPFLEWKLLLRGLLAWYARDDARAQENWHRLDPQRLPWKIAAPLRASVDKAFLTAQSPEAQKALQKQAEQVTDTALVRPLRLVEESLHRNNIGTAFRQVDGLMGTLRTQAPALAARLADCFFWAIVGHGHPGDIVQYMRMFPAPPSDPHLDRLRALAQEKRDLLYSAISSWQEMERSIASLPTVWPGDVGVLARALLWEHMGQLAAHAQLESDDEPSDVPLPTPTPETCLQRSIALQPKRPTPYQALIAVYMLQNKKPKAVKAAKDLLEQSPDNAQALELLGNLAIEKKASAPEAVVYYERALRANPLERRLRGKLINAHAYSGMHFLTAKPTKKQGDPLDLARGHWEAALKLSDSDRTLTRCRLALLDARRDQAEASAAWLAQANAEPDRGLAIAYALAVESERIGLPADVQKSYGAALTQIVKEPITPAMLLHGLYVVAQIHQAPTPAQKKWEKKVLGLVRKAQLEGLSEDELVRACRLLLDVDNIRFAKVASDLGIYRYRSNPYFLLFGVDVILQKKQPRRSDLYGAKRNLEDARKLVAQAPREQQDELKAMIERQEVEVAEWDQDDYFGDFNPFSAFERMFGR